MRKLVDQLYFVGMGLLLAVLIILPLIWAGLQWIECRRMGHSVMYCIAHIL